MEASENPGIVSAAHITVDRIGELVKLGITIPQASVAKYMVRHRKRPSPTWKTFLTNHASMLAPAVLEAWNRSLTFSATSLTSR